jgi:phospholipid-transporting ATPase
MKRNKDKGDGEMVSNVNFHDDKFYEDFGNPKSENYDNIKRVLLNLAICHNIIIEHKHGRINYNASSPDELALVNAARFFGVKYIDRDEENNIYIDFKKKREKWKLLNTIEFNSTRKRMTVVAKDPEGLIHVYCKGADSILFPLLAPFNKVTRHVEKKTNQFLDEYSKDGLRTLLLVEKVTVSLFI